MEAAHRQEVRVVREVVQDGFLAQQEIIKLVVDLPVHRDKETTAVQQVDQPMEVAEAGVQEQQANMVLREAEVAMDFLMRYQEYLLIMQVAVEVVDTAQGLQKVEALAA